MTTATKPPTKAPRTKPVECWHFIGADRRLQYDMADLIVKPKSIARFSGTPKLCERGLHGSIRAIDALQYAPGPVICRVQIGGEVIHGSDKLVGTSRKCLWLADATNTLHEFACLCAEDALRVAKVDDVRCWHAIETKRKWLRGEATDGELAAARAAAWDAAWDAAWAAAWDAAWAAARAAAWDAARAAAWDAAWAAAWAAALAAALAAAWAAARDAAWDAAWDAQNTRLESMLLALNPAVIEGGEGRA